VGAGAAKRLCSSMTLKLQLKQSDGPPVSCLVTNIYWYIKPLYYGTTTLPNVTVGTVNVSFPQLVS